MRRMSPRTRRCASSAVHGSAGCCSACGLVRVVLKEWSLDTPESHRWWEACVSQRAVSAIGVLCGVDPLELIRVDVSEPQCLACRAHVHVVLLVIDEVVSCQTALLHGFRVAVDARNVRQDRAAPTENTRSTLKLNGCFSTAPGTSGVASYRQVGRRQRRFSA